MTALLQLLCHIGGLAAFAALVLSVTARCDESPGGKQ